MKNLSLTALCMAFTTVLALAGPLNAAPRYRYHDLATLGGDNSEALGINRKGQVVGIAEDDFPVEWPFLKDPDQAMQNLGGFPGGGWVIGGTLGRAFGVNNAGQVVGWAYDANGFPWAFLKKGNQDMENLGALGGNASYARGINDAGQVVGDAIDANGIFWAFQMNTGQAMQNLGSLKGEGSVAYAINNNGQVVGSADTGEGFDRAFLKNPNQKMMEDLGALGGTWSKAYAINDRGWIVGEANDADGRPRAFLKRPGHDMENLGGLGGTLSVAKASTTPARW